MKSWHASGASDPQMSTPPLSSPKCLLLHYQATRVYHQAHTSTYTPHTQAHAYTMKVHGHRSHLTSHISSSLHHLLQAKLTGSKVHGIFHRSLHQPPEQIRNAPRELCGENFSNVPGLSVYMLNELILYSRCTRALDSDFENPITP